MTTFSSSQEQTVSGKPAFWPLAATRSPHLRLTLSPEYRGLTDTEREQVFELAFGEGVSPAEYEAFFSGPDLSRPRSPRGLGAATGSALGPYGAIAGAVAGGVGQLLGLLKDPRVLGAVSSLAQGRNRPVAQGDPGWLPMPPAHLLDLLSRLPYRFLSRPCPGRRSRSGHALPGGTQFLRCPQPDGAPLRLAAAARRRGGPDAAGQPAQSPLP